jgi:surfeit locus 1 family protein
MSLRSRYLLFAISLMFAAIFVGLGLWQLRRLRERRAENAIALAARHQEVLDLNAQSAETGPRAQRRVKVTGEYDRSYEIVLRGHMYREVPGVHVVTPLRLRGSDSAVLVNRGYVPSPDATFAATDSLNEPGTQQVEGIAFDIPVSDDGGAPLVSQGKETWRRLDLAALRQRIPYPIVDVYILQQPDESLPLYPRRLDPRPLDDGPHLSYALQWFAFATIAVAGGWIFVVKRGL